LWGEGLGGYGGVIGVGWDVQERNFGSVVRAVESVGIVVRCDFISFACRYGLASPQFTTLIVQKEVPCSAQASISRSQQKSITSAIRLNLPSAFLQILRCPSFVLAKASMLKALTMEPRVLILLLLSYFPEGYSFKWS
jgi:hypothetical protein